jgi:hypothetical protein
MNPKSISVLAFPSLCSITLSLPLAIHQGPRGLFHESGRMLLCATQA